MFGSVQTCWAEVVSHSEAPYTNVPPMSFVSSGERLSQKLEINGIVLITVPVEASRKCTPSFPEVSATLPSLANRTAPLSGSICHSRLPVLTSRLPTSSDW